MGAYGCSELLLYYKQRCNESASGKERGEIRMDPVVERQVKYEEENKSRIKSMVHVFQVPLHYPRYTKADYESMPEGKLDRLLAEYGLKVGGDVASKRKYAMGAFLWPEELR